MAKIFPANLAPDAYPRFRGNILTRSTKFGLVVQKWPEKRGPAKTWQAYFLSQQFAIAARMAANTDPLQWETAKFLSTGTVWLPRDILVMAAYGKLYEIQDPRGNVWSQSDHSAPVEPVAGTWTNIATCPLDVNTSQPAVTVTLRQRIAAAGITPKGGSQTRFVVWGSPLQTAPILAAYIGKGATSGNSYAFASTPKQCFFGGLPGYTIPKGGFAICDPCSYVPASTDNVVISIAYGVPTRLANKTVQTNWTNFFKNGNDAATVAAVGYSANTAAVGVQSLQAFFPT